MFNIVLLRVFLKVYYCNYYYKRSLEGPTKFIIRHFRHVYSTSTDHTLTKTKHHRKTPDPHHNALEVNAMSTNPNHTLSAQQLIYKIVCTVHSDAMCETHE